MKKALYSLIFIIICFSVGFISSKIQQESIQNWYPKLNKPQLNPPNYIFPIAWSILYTLMGISIGSILGGKNSKKLFFLKIFIIQLLLNFSWSLLFFYLQNPLLGFINIILLDFVILYYIINTYKREKISSLLFIPYLLWTSFASYLNLYIFLQN